MEICRRRQSLARLHIVQFRNQLRQFLRDILWQSAHLFCSGHIVVLLIRARAFALLIAQGVICALGQQSLKLADQGLAHRLPLLKGIQHPVIGRYGVLDLEQGAHVACVGGHAAVVEDLTGVVVCDAVILDLSGVIDERGSVSVHLQGNICCGPDFLFMPTGDDFIIEHSGHPPFLSNSTTSLGYMQEIRENHTLFATSSRTILSPSSWLVR